MAKRVVVIVSGETDRRAVPHLCRLVTADMEFFDVRKPPGNSSLTPEQAVKIAKAAWYELLANPPQKFVILVDADEHCETPSHAASPFQSAVDQLGHIAAAFLVAVAVRHLESWYFADEPALRAFLGRDLGAVDPSQPDKMANPKLHLTQLLKSQRRLYTAQLSESIAMKLDPDKVAARSPSFSKFLAMVQNGETTGI